MDQLDLNSVEDITRAIEKGNRAFEAFKTYNDERLEELTKQVGGGKHKELDGKLTEINAEIESALQAAEKMQRENEWVKERIEELEARQKAPGATKAEKLEASYKDAFESAMRGQFKDHDQVTALKAVVDDAKQARAAGEVKDITIGVDIQGGFALPEEISRSIERMEIEISPVRSLVKTVQVGTNDYKELVSIHGGTSGWVGETDTRTATGTPNLRERAPSFGELYAYPQVSEWALDDIFFNVTDWLTEDVAMDFAQAEGLAVISGDGSNKPTGMLNTTPVTTADSASPMRAAAAYQYISLTDPASPAVINADSLIDLTYNVKSQYRARGSFVMESLTAAAVRKLKTSNGDYIWEPNFQVGEPARILGFPMVTWEDMPALAADAFSVGFGDFRRAYVLADRVGLRIQAEGFTNVGYVRFYIRRREGGTVLNNDAVKFLRIADS